MKTFRKILFGSSFVATLWFMPTELTADEATMHRFRTEYPPAAKFLSDRFDRCNGQFRHEWIENGRRRELTVDFFRSHGFDKFEVHFEIPGERSTKGTGIYCVDERTAFELNKAGESTGYRLIKQRMNEFDREIFDIEYARVPRSPLGGYRKSLIAMMNSGAIEITDARVDPSSPEIVEATFEVDDDTPLKQIKASFDTRNHWAIVRETIYVGSPLKIATDYRVDYGDQVIDGVRVPIRLKVENEKLPYEFLKWHFTELPRESFTLTHYGLPDLIGNGRSRIGIFETLLAMMAILALIAGVALQRFSNRRNGARSLEAPLR